MCDVKLTNISPPIWGNGLQKSKWSVCCLLPFILMQIRFYYLNWKLSLSNLRPNLILCSAESSIFHWYFSILQLTPVTIATLIYGNLYLLLLVLNKFTMKHTQNYFGTKGRSRWFFRGVSSVSSIKVWNKSEYAQQWFIIIWILQMQFGPPCSRATDLGGNSAWSCKVKITGKSCKKQQK